MEFLTVTDKVTNNVKSLVSRQKPKVFIFGAIGLVVIAAAILVLVLKLKPASAASVQQRTAKAFRGDISISLTGSGVIQSSNRVSINPSVTGTITKVYFKAGDSVKTGDLLYEIDDSDARLKVANLKNNIEQQQLTVDNNLKSVSGLEVKAPFNGKITNIIPSVGDDVQRNSALLTITDTSKLKVTLPFGASTIKSIKKGMSVSVNISEFMQSVDGKVTYVSNYPYTTSSGGEVYDVEITLENPGSLTADMTVNAEITTESGIQSSIGSGKLQYTNSEVIKSISGGKVIEIIARNNQYVHQGELLMKLSNDDLIISTETSNLKLKDLHSQLETAENQLSQYKIYSPIDGVIVSQSVEVGDEATPSKTAAVISDIEHMEFSVPIDELDIAKIKTGLKVNVTVDALSETKTAPLTGVVTSIAMEGTSSNGVTTYPVTIQIDDSSKLKAGMNANAEIIINEKQNTIMVPVEAVQKAGNMSFVMVLGNGNAASAEPGNSGSVPNSGRINNRGNRVPGSFSGSNGNQSYPADSTNKSNTGSTGGSDATNSKTPSANTNSSTTAPGITGNITESRLGNSQQIPAANAIPRSFSNNSGYYAGAQLRRVEIGINNDGFVEILSGLSEGEEVVLPPLAASSGSSQTRNQTGSGGMGIMGGFGAPTNVRIRRN